MGAIELNTYPSKFIKGSPVSRKAQQVCLSPDSLDHFLREMRKRIDRDPRGDIDGEEYIDYLGPWRITVKHIYKVHEERGGDHYCGMWEVVPVVDYDELEVVNASDEQYNQSLRGLMQRLNELCRERRY